MEKNMFDFLNKRAFFYGAAICQKINPRHLERGYICMDCDYGYQNIQINKIKSDYSFYELVLENSRKFLLFVFEGIAYILKNINFEKVRFI
jgi:hypothetical protein